MNVLSDIRVLYKLALSPIRGESHTDRLDSFYSAQAGDYDAFRKRLLQGREEMIGQLSVPEGGVWVDMGGGTGANVEFMGVERERLANVYIVDLCPSLLDKAKDRIAANGWSNVHPVHADATNFLAKQGSVDLVTFSYSLTMIPDWFAAIDHARSLLRPGGQIGVVDFYVSRKYPSPGLARHPWTTRAFWPLWFGRDNVFPSPDHLPYLQRKFRADAIREGRAKTPYLPMLRMPYYTFIGRA